LFHIIFTQMIILNSSSSHPSKYVHFQTSCIVLTENVWSSSMIWQLGNHYILSCFANQLSNFCCYSLTHIADEIKQQSVLYFTMSPPGRCMKIFVVTLRLYLQAVGTRAVRCSCQIWERLVSSPGRSDRCPDSCGTAPRIRGSWVVHAYGTCVATTKIVSTRKLVRTVKRPDN